ncbi:MAG: hypothetical protein KA745_15135, partial [Gemmatimonadales bacterium]|nr:hypothetical protein [Gemmatimonadales bacterium]
MTRLLTARLLLVAATTVAATVPASAQAKATVTPADIDRLTGAPWRGTLEYLDYTSQKQVTIKSTLAVRRLPARSDGVTAWSMAVGYTDEPDANSGETALLSADGRTFRGEAVQERSVDPAGTLRIVTEQAGLRVGDCVSVERGQFNNIRLADDARCTAAANAPV